MSVEISELSGLLDSASKMVNDRLAHAPGWQVLQVIQTQLQAMQDDVNHERVPTAEAKKRINIGVLAVREFEANDPEFADILIKAAYLYKKLSPRLSTTVPVPQEQANALVAEANTLQATGGYEEAVKA
ncbi:immunity protein Tsi6 family protein [Gracilinema caldarium]|uniref:Tsi6 domain-containing protein n=1 Tax=Gracilinema caldarium (strain ATCC 51460 / DSM 7334 / H1) TaxID=744872 RepID=F8F4A3_GRAC1|nr:immunity protein Tsi6 family protein [Gracilinema caldarium]AEJ20550.1 hypothetical protein Spica_2441 [Gracilinema caldarium DSM 7334]